MARGKNADPMTLLAAVDARQLKIAQAADEALTAIRALDARRRELQDARRRANGVAQHIDGTAPDPGDIAAELRALDDQEEDLKARYNSARAAQAALEHERHAVIVENRREFENRAERLTEAAVAARAEVFAVWRHAEQMHNEAVGGHILVADAMRAIHSVEYRPLLPNPLTEATTHIRTALGQPPPRMWPAANDTETQREQVERDETERRRMFEVLR